ncbi:MAG TPA: hypothetical protein VK284_04105 [Streptosporangiaceae bacterium]|nr:hypothetical protein [Streptosporangiaceae bacterium]
MAVMARHAGDRMQVMEFWRVLSFSGEGGGCVVWAAGGSAGDRGG